MVKKIEINEDGWSFEDWMKQVDDVIRRVTGGFTSGDLIDQNYWYAWHDCVNPVEMAETALIEDGFPQQELAELIEELL